jgi:tetratricopeptide (TPR) repeat protein
MEALVRGGYFEARGHTQRHLNLLDEAIALAAEVHPSDAPHLRHHLLSKRGNACVAEGDFARAIEFYQAALDCAPNPTRQVVVQAVIGKTYALAGNHEAATHCFAIATQLAEAHYDIDGLCMVLEQQSHAAAEGQDFETERDLALRGVQLCKEHDRSYYLGYFYLNLGSAEFELGIRKARASHQEAYEHALRMDDEALLAISNSALAMDYLGLEEIELACKHLAEALRLVDKLGHVEKAASLRRLVSGFNDLETGQNIGGEQ